MNSSMCKTEGFLKLEMVMVLSNQAITRTASLTYSTKGLAQGEIMKSTLMDSSIL